MMGFGGSGGGGGTIGSAADVALNSPGANEQLLYNSGVGKWQNGPTASRLVETVRTITTSGSAQIIPDVSVATVHNITLSANCTFTFPTATAGKSLTIRLTQGNGGFSATWPGSVIWPGGNSPVITATSGKYDIFSFACFTDGQWTGFIAGQNY